MDQELLSALKEAVAFHDDEDNETLARWRDVIARAEAMQQQKEH